MPVNIDSMIIYVNDSYFSVNLLMKLYFYVGLFSAANEVFDNYKFFTQVSSIFG